MKTRYKVILFILLTLAAIAVAAFYISQTNIAVLNPKGMIGKKERDLIVTASLLMLIVVIPVFIFTWAFAWKYRADAKSRHEPNWEHNYIAEYCWWGVPLVIIIILAIITWRSSHELNPFKPIENGKKPLVIQAVALQWKWLFIYPEQGIAVVNKVKFPANTPINFEITADAPMNSFWIPELGGQIYAMPAMKTKLHLIADEVGSYRGVSSNLSGTGFSGMFFEAVSSTEAEFNQWIQNVKKSSPPLGLKEYRQLVKPSEYNKVAYYVLMKNNLFDQIMDKYNSPSGMAQEH